MEESKTRTLDAPGESDRDAVTRPERAGATRPHTGSDAPLQSQLSSEGDEGGHELEQGTRVQRYILLKPLGKGGMGVVYVAYDPDLDRKVALKLLRPDREAPEGHTGRAWMLREAQAMARVSHPNVISVYDVGTFGEQVFLAMELLPGRNLSDRIRQEKYTWREILRIFLEAGQGLRAAHRAGLVHRDFKPANVLVGEDGRVCVLDFGLARLAEVSEAEEEARAGEAGRREPRTGDPLALALPESNLMLGTPQYMPPEQYLGTGVDARADQFSFCASLYWALYRQRPFEPRKVAQTAAESSRGAPNTGDSWRRLPHVTAAQEPPADSPVPSWVRRAVMRGLSLHPEARFPSMDALLEALSQEQRRVQRRGAWAAMGTLALAAAGGGMYLFHQSRLCAGAEPLVASVWGPETRRQVEAAFTATGQPFAAETALKVGRILDGYAGDWARVHTEACEATRVRGEQTEELLSMRMVCLERRRKDLGALTGVLSEADAQVVERAVEAVSALPSLQPCQDIASLAEQPPLPADPAVRASIEKLGERIAQVKALQDAGRYKAGVELARQLEPEVVATAYLPLQAELRFHLGWLLQQEGEVEEGIRQLERAFDTAESGRSDRTRLEVLTKLIYTFASNGHPEEAERWGRVAVAILNRMGGEPPLALDLNGNLGYVALLRGHYQDAWDSFERARALAETTLGPEDPKRAKVSHGLGLAALRLGQYPKAIELLGASLRQTEAAKGPQHPEVATRHTMLATAYRESGDLENALTHVRQALEVRKATQGPEHLDVADTMDELGMSLIALKRHDEAVQTFREALAIKRKVLGDQHPDLSYSYDGIGQALLAQGRPVEAIEPLRQALSYEETEPEGLAQTGFALAKALWEVGPEREQARGEAGRARERYAKLEKPEQVAEIDTWLASHPEEAPRAEPPQKVRAPKRRTR
ncbi:serine/threonine-protein kinase [Hyalangium rubrum]|uniref:Serine/threonine-protein kinase n=1 Tax=Hyalangium rubrum TaxID=3103134 RepID=A0ABU5HBV7_9BACT|nr:serine/threonine-protein kinase [Hyalangium sp. s54d21]MDY7230958.1 serine/threonine-protein kinase [Hyalangium sp. s54d21]